MSVMMLCVVVAAIILRCQTILLMCCALMSESMACQSHMKWVLCVIFVTLVFFDAFIGQLIIGAVNTLAMISQLSLTTNHECFWVTGAGVDFRSLTDI